MATQNNPTTGLPFQAPQSIGVPNLAYLAGIQIPLPVDGIMVYVANDGVNPSGSYYQLSLTSGGAPDGYLIIDTFLGGTSRWLRLNTTPGTSGSSGLTMFNNSVALAGNPQTILNTDGTTITLAIVAGKPTLSLTGAAGSRPSANNKGMVASVTAADGDVACATVVSGTPVGYVGVNVNGIGTEVGNAVKTKACYFSGNGGATARAQGAIAAGDRLYWNGTIAGYQLDATYAIDFLFNV